MMDVAVVVFVTCLGASDVDCLTRELQVDPRATQLPYVCVKEAQPAIAKWLEEHPKWTLKNGFKCVAPGKNS